MGSIVERITKVLESNGNSLRVSEITKRINKNLVGKEKKIGYRSVSTILHFNATKGKLFKHVGYGLFDLIDSMSKEIRENVLAKLIHLMTEYQSKMQMAGIPYDTRLYNVSFNLDELEYIREKVRRINNV